MIDCSFNLQVLRAVDGRDVSSLFRGKNGGHAHSEAAWKMVQGYRCPNLANAVGPDRLEDRQPIDSSAPIIAQVRGRQEDVLDRMYMQ